MKMIFIRFYSLEAAEPLGETRESKACDTPLAHSSSSGDCPPKIVSRPSPGKQVCFVIIIFFCCGFLLLTLIPAVKEQSHPSLCSECFKYIVVLLSTFYGMLTIRYKRFSHAFKAVVMLKEKAVELRVVALSQVDSLA